MQCFILAGGFATRLWPLTEHRAKPLLPLAGKPILSHLVDGIPAELPISISTNAVFADDIGRWAKTMHGRKIEVVIEDAHGDDHKLGALGALAKWITENSIDDDVLLLAGDNYCEANLGRFIGLFRNNPLIAAHDLQELERAKPFGTIIIDPKSSADSPLKRVMKFEEKPAHPQSSLVSAGWWLLPKSTIPILIEHAATHPDNVGGLFEEVLRRNISIDCMVFSERWKDIGSFDSYLAIHCELVGDRPLIDADATVDSTTKLIGSVAVGPHSLIRNSTLTDCIVFNDVEIEDCVLTRCIIDEECVLKGIDLTGKMLRAGTVLKREK